MIAALFVILQSVLRLPSSNQLVDSTFAFLNLQDEN